MVYAVEQHVISCVLSDIDKQMSGVKWDPATTGTFGYTLEDGTYVGGSKSQTSKLTISAAKLKTLGATKDSETFTCKITVGTTNQDVTATQVVTIFNPSKITL